MPKEARRKSSPPAPFKVSSPLPPSRVLGPSSPVMMSSKGDPVAFSNPVKESVPPPPVSVPVTRLMVTAEVASK